MRPTLNWRWRIFAFVSIMQFWRGWLLLDPGPLAASVAAVDAWPWLYWAASAACAVAALTRGPSAQVAAGTAVGGLAILRAVVLVDAAGWEGAGTTVPDSLTLAAVIAGSWGWAGTLLADVKATEGRR